MHMTVEDGIRIDLVCAAYNAIDGNDEVDWDLLERHCPAEKTLGEFIDILVGASKEGDGE